MQVMNQKWACNNNKTITHHRSLSLSFSPGKILSRDLLYTRLALDDLVKCVSIRWELRSKVILAFIML